MVEHELKRSLYIPAVGAAARQVSASHQSQARKARHGEIAMFLAECQVRYVVGCIEEMITGSYRSMAIKRDIFQRYNDVMDEKLKTLVWNDPDVRS